MARSAGSGRSGDKSSPKSTHKDGFADLRELHTALDTHYPGLDGDDPVDVVDFELIVTPE